MKLGGFVNVVEMFGNRWGFSGEEVGYLLLCEGKGLMLEGELEVEGLMGVV